MIIVQVEYIFAFCKISSSNQKICYMCFSNKKKIIDLINSFIINKVPLIYNKLKLLYIIGIEVRE